MRGSSRAPWHSLGGVEPRDAGLASGLINNSWQIGGALGIAVMTSVAMAGAAGSDTAAARVAGFQTAFTVAAAIAVVGLVAVLAVLRTPLPRSRRPDAVTPAGPR